MMQAAPVSLINEWIAAYSIMNGEPDEEPTEKTPPKLDNQAIFNRLKTRLS